MKLYVYPFCEPQRRVGDGSEFRRGTNPAHLYKHLLENGFIEAFLEGYNPSYLPIKSSEVLAKIRGGWVGKGRFLPKSRRLSRNAASSDFSPSSPEKLSRGSPRLPRRTVVWHRTSEYAGACRLSAT